MRGVTRRVARRAGVSVVSAVLAVAFAPVAEADPVAFPLSALESAFLTDADIKALADWGAVEPVTAPGTECTEYAGGTWYQCVRDYPLHQFGSRPYFLRVISVNDVAGARDLFDRSKVSIEAAGVETLSSDATSFSVVRRDYASSPHRIVTSGRLVGNHYVEAACWGAADRFRAEDINTCTQLLINAQSERLTDLVSPIVTPPGAPTDVLVDVDDGRATVTWLAPTDDGGAPITRYTATTSAGDLTCSVESTAADVQSCVIPGARPGKTYVFTVTAENSAGAGAESTASSAAGFTTRASKPRGVRARVADTRATITWKRPKELGGLPVRRYVVTDQRGATVCTASGRSCVASELDPDTRYRFTVRAVNARGAGPGATTRWVRTPQPPPAPLPDPVPQEKPEQTVG